MPRETGEPDWSQGCDKPPGQECPDCIEQRKHFGYVLENGKWVKS